MTEDFHRCLLIIEALKSGDAAALTAALALDTGLNSYARALSRLSVLRGGQPEQVKALINAAGIDKNSAAFRSAVSAAFIYMIANEQPANRDVAALLFAEVKKENIDLPLKMIFAAVAACGPDKSKRALARMLVEAGANVEEAASAQEMALQGRKQAIDARLVSLRRFRRDVTKNKSLR